MAGKKEYKQTAEEILDIIGGKENVISAAHCATRLRLVLKDESLVNVKALENVAMVKGNFATSGQFQIILGSGIVDEVYKEFVQIADIKESSKAEVKKEADKKLNLGQKLVKTLADVFVPILPALIVSGLLMGINNVFTSEGLFISGKSLIEAYPGMSDLASMINTFANAAYTFLPVLIGFSATKLFGGNPYLGAVIGMIMVHPDLLNGYGYGEAITNGTIPTWNIFGLLIEKVGYQGTVLPVLASSYILAKCEQFFRKIVPEVLDNLLTPLLAVFVTGFLTFTIVGTIMRSLGNILTNGILWLHDSLGIIGGAVFGFIYAPFTLTGMHHSLLPIDIQLLSDMAVTGGSFLLAIAACNNVSQGASAFAAMLISDDKKLKGVALTSGISAMLGITEPAMFGVNLKLKFPFYAAMVGSAAGCAYVTLTNVINISPGAAGLIGFVCIRPESIINFFIGIVISFVVGFITTFIFVKSKRLNKQV
ncbi:sucrose-specific PTS transporter subunit IIBC [uncultured Clostridium sp.]|uniref:sucrose-specific PTS transporter subunit IIBC n=1 Tax=uncultured Clostridium sp. TaxID=59620 RepID=UPI0025D8FE04|nr:sucrose-specific PTS transporter subunit IIBC [uncultured Clostridium sp.]